MRIILVTYGCDPEGISEPIVSFNWAHRLSAEHDVTVLNYRRVVESPVAPHLPDARVIEWAEPRGLERIERFNTMARPAYGIFMAKARRWIRQRLASGERFDVGYQPVPVALRYPSPLNGWGIPYVIGPVGGSLVDPPGFDSRDTSPVFTQLRRLDGLRLRRDPLLRRSFAEAECTLGIAQYVEEMFSDARLGLRRFEVMPDTALETLPTPTDRRGRSGPVKLLYVGRIVRTKGVQDAVAAFAKAVADPAVDAVFDIFGDGFDRPACESLAREMGVSDRVIFHGFVDRTIVEDKYREADVFVFPSYREAGGTVTFEAMGHGLPIIVADRGGPASAVDKTCGITVSTQSPERFVTEISEAIRRLATDPELRERMSGAARDRVAKIGTWPGRVERMNTILREAAEAA